MKNWSIVAIWAAVAVVGSVEPLSVLVTAPCAVAATMVLADAGAV